MALLRDIGFNRISLGVQDFDDDVQRAVNRIQTERRDSRRAGCGADRGFQLHQYRSDLRPAVSDAESFRRTLDDVLEVEPDRLSVFNYAHLPTVSSPSVASTRTNLPAAAEKLDILKMTGEALAECRLCLHRYGSFRPPR